MTRKALLLGIDAYEAESLRLPAAKRDTEALAEALVQAEFANAQVTPIVGKPGDLSQYHEPEKTGRWLFAHGATRR
jgi:hypothetical protein